MRVLTIKQNGPLVVAVTSGGQRASGATVQSTLSKLALTDPPYHEFDAVARLFERIPDSGGGTQIHQGIDS